MRYSSREDSFHPTGKTCSVISGPFELNEPASEESLDIQASTQVTLLRQGVGLDDPHRFLPTPTIL